MHRAHLHPRWTAMAIAAVAVAAAVLLFARPGAGPRTTVRPQSLAGPAPATPGGATPAARHPARRPNIVFVLTDDLATNLVRYMPAVQAMEAEGLTFQHYFVTDSLCCPSRASIFTGDYPHTTGIRGNGWPVGGFRAFRARGELPHTFASALQRAGYRTAMMGKFLNGYLDPEEGASGVPDTFVPPGWNEWDVAGWGYPEFNYEMNQNGIVRRYGHRPADYLTDVLARLGVAFVDRAAASHRPFFLELAPFAPHAPYTPAPRDAHAFPGLRAPRGPSFDVLPTRAPGWLAGRPPLTAANMAAIDRAFRRRVQSVQAVDDMITRIENALVADGLSRNTYVLFSSDNGLHMGEYRLLPGKMTAFDTDIHVPLVVTGPGVPAAARTGSMAENVDLAKTFAAIAGRRFPSDGHSLLGLFHGRTPAGWRNAILVEHHGPDLNPADPDFERRPSGNPVSYEAMRTARFLYVEYRDGEREFYDLRSDPFELHNIVGRLSPATAAALHRRLLAMAHCHGGPACWRAEHVPAANMTRPATTGGRARSTVYQRNGAGALRSGHLDGGGQSSLKRGGDRVRALSLARAPRLGCSAQSQSAAPHPAPRGFASAPGSSEHGPRPQSC